MTAYNLHIPGVTTAGALLTRTPAAVETKTRRQKLLQEVRRRNRERYKRFLARHKPHLLQSSGV